jgi:uncharacterized protein (TIGR02246 family)
MRGAIMMTVAAAGLAVPAVAQQSTSITDQQKRAVQAVADNYVKGVDTKDAKGIAALYTEDGILVGTYAPQTLIGRAAIEKSLADAVQQGQMGSNLAVEFDWKSFAPIGNDMIIGSGTWADTLPMPPAAQATTGQPAPQSGSSQPPPQLALKPGDREHGSWTALYVMRGGVEIVADEGRAHVAQRVPGDGGDLRFGDAGKLQDASLRCRADQSQDGGGAWARHPSLAHRPGE